MMKSEFETLAMKNSDTISATLYKTIERFYMSENDYHQTHGGTDESKLGFCKRVYGGKVNTPATILKKTITEAIKENRYALLGCDISEERLSEMDSLIKDEITWEATQI